MFTNSPNGIEVLSQASASLLNNCIYEHPGCGILVERRSFFVGFLFSLLLLFCLFCWCFVGFIYFAFVVFAVYCLDPPSWLSARWFLFFLAFLLLFLLLFMLVGVLLVFCCCFFSLLLLCSRLFCCSFPMLLLCCVWWVSCFGRSILVEHKCCV